MFAIALGVTAAGVALWILFKICNSVIVVKQDEWVVIEHWGSFSRVLQPGLNFIMPFIESPRSVTWRYPRDDGKGESIDTVETTWRIPKHVMQFDFPEMEVSSFERLPFMINCYTEIQIIDPQRVIYDVSDMKGMLHQALYSAIRHAASKILIREAADCKLQLMQVVEDVVGKVCEKKYAVRLCKIDIQDIWFEGKLDEEFEAMAMEKEQQFAATERLAAARTTQEKQAENDQLQEQNRRNLEMYRTESNRQIEEANATNEMMVKWIQAEKQSQIDMLGQKTADEIARMELARKQKDAELQLGLKTQREELKARHRTAMLSGGFTQEYFTRKQQAKAFGQVAKSSNHVMMLPEASGEYIGWHSAMDTIRPRPRPLHGENF